MSQQDSDNEDGSYLMVTPETGAYRKCMCCKELGHPTAECPQDPNLRTKVNGLAELRRVQRISHQRKLFLFTNVMTTQLLKTCVKVPKVRRLSDIDSDDSNYETKAAKARS